MSKFSESLTRLRKSADLSQQALADQLGVSRSLIGMYESASRNPSYEVIQKIAAFFGVSVDYLFGYVNVGEFSSLFRAELAKALRDSDPEDRKAAGIDDAELTLIIDGTIPVSFDHACNLADALGISLDSILGRDEKKSTSNYEGGRTDRIIELLTSLPDSQKESLLQYLQYLQDTQHK